MANLGGRWCRSVVARAGSAPGWGCNHTFFAQARGTVTLFAFNASGRILSFDLLTLCAPTGPASVSGQRGAQGLTGLVFDEGDPSMSGRSAIRMPKPDRRGDLYFALPCRHGLQFMSHYQWTRSWADKRICGVCEVKYLVIPVTNKLLDFLGVDGGRSPTGVTVVIMPAPPFEGF